MSGSGIVWGISLRLYHYTTLDFGQKAISQSRLKIARILELNDPFDMKPFRLNDEVFGPAFDEMIASLNQDMGVLCLSETWKSPVMWSHYASKHRGMVLGFDVNDKCLTKVKYVDARMDPRVLFDEHRELSEDAVKNYMMTKHRSWEYENEQRLVLDLKDRDPETSLYFVEFGESLMLSEVLVGAMASKECEAQVRANVEGAFDDVPVSKMDLSLDRYEMVRC